MRDLLARLGLRHTKTGGRVQGRALDRPRLRSMILRRDPRVLVARRIERHSDLFMGVVIDCSGSMSSGDNIGRAKLFGVLLAEAVRGLPGVDARFFGFTDSVIYDCGTADRCAVPALETSGGNNDAAALAHAARVARSSRRSAKLLVMISDGLPTECSVDALRGLVRQLSTRGGMVCAQVALRPLEEEAFPHYVELLDEDPSDAVRRFGVTVARLVRRALGR